MKLFVKIAMIALPVLAISFWGGMRYAKEINAKPIDTLLNNIIDTSLNRDSITQEKYADSIADYYTVSDSLIKLKHIDDSVYREGFFQEKKRRAAISPKTKGYQTDDELYAKAMNLEAILINRANNFNSLGAVIKHMTTASPNYPHVPAIFPCQPGTFRRISSKFGNRVHPITGKQKNHKGLDFAAVYGTPVFATADGYVVSSFDSNRGYGNCIKIKHKFNFITLFGHLSRRTVPPGVYIKRGTIIGYVGSTGLSTGPHLHYEILKNSTPIDPIEFSELAFLAIKNGYK
jgi:murein DD-endopeptidase MepM/ murein hydrolase activator NlpD